ncbi:MAG: gamma-glutamyltransferase, partial [Chloroflexi bacterium]|nr:gamma-glutamyltransferase [Chloroflexota bacterium]
GLCLAHRLFGRLPLQQVLEPAIHYAEEGFEVNWYFCLLVGNAMEEMERFPATREVFVPTGFPPKHAPKPADRIVQKELGRLLRRIAAEGPSAFYEGEVAAAVEEDMARNGGLLTREDMARYQAVVRVPTRVAYRGYDVLAAPGSNGCLTLLQTLRILEHLDLRGMGHNSRQYLHAFIEAARHAFADRYRFVGDPEAVDVPMKGLLSEEYSRQIAKLIRRDRASSALEEEPWTYFLGQELHDPWAFEGKPRPRHAFAPSAHATDTDCTTHFNVADAEGNVVSCTQTAVSLFGSKVMTPGTGILWGNGMVWFNPKAGFANSIAPWKRPLVNMAPVLVLRGGRPYLALGSPGGRRIINCNTQVLLNILEFGMGVQEAIAQPRVDTSTRVTFVDSRLDEREMQGLIDMGHQAQAVTEGPAASNFATPLGILIDPATGLKHGGADVFRIAEVCGW